jgi:hypothetical protein
VIVTEALKRLSKPTCTVTVVPLAATEEGLERQDVLRFDHVRLVTFSDYGLTAD